MGSDSVTQVSLEDARRCAAKFGQLQPTEDQWHYTATGLARGRMYPWRNSLTVDDRQRRLSHDLPVDIARKPHLQGHAVMNRCRRPDATCRIDSIGVSLSGRCCCEAGSAFLLMLLVNRIAA